MSLPWLPQSPGVIVNPFTSEEELFIQSLAALGDPGADRLIFWDESQNSFQYLTAGSGLTITDTTITASAGSLDGSGTTNQITYWVDSDTIGALAVATYPSLTELSYVKGVTSSIQTQLNAKAASLGSDDNYVTDAEKVVIGNTSGTNTGDNATNTQYSGLAASKLDVVVDGTPNTDHTANGPQTNTFASGYSSAIGDLVFFGSGGKWLEVDADAVATCNGLMGIALEAKTDTQAMLVALPGSFVRDDSWNWTVGATLYAGETLGAMQETIPTGTDAVIKVVGFAVSADVIFFNPSPDQQTTVA